ALGNGLRSDIVRDRAAAEQPLAQRVEAIPLRLRRPAHITPELFPGGALEGRSIRALRAFVAGQRGIEQDLDADVRDRERAAAPNPSRRQPDDRLVSERPERRRAVEDLV